MKNRIAFRAVRPDFRSRHDFVWPFPGKVAKAPGPFWTDNTGGCPTAVGDGLCLAKTWDGSASGGIPAITVLVCEFREKDVLGEDHDKIRVRKTKVLRVVDFPRFLTGMGRGIKHAEVLPQSLRGISLRGAILGGVDLCGRDLSYADLRRSYLEDANFRGANLTNVQIRGADTTNADFSGVKGLPQDGMPAGWKAYSHDEPWRQVSSR